MQSRVQLPNVGFELARVLLPRDTVHSRSRTPAQDLEGGCQPLLGDVVQERGELRLPVPSGCFAYTVQRTGRALSPALCPGRVLLVRVALGQAPSLRRLRRRLPGLVRRLRRYYGPVRLPVASLFVWPSASLNRVGALDWLISRLNTQPARTPVNASPPPSRVLAHDSGPSWVAGPSM